MPPAPPYTDFLSPYASVPPHGAHHLAETHHRHAAHSGRITALQNGENDRSRIEFELLSCLGQMKTTVEHLLLYGHGIELAVAQLQFRFLFGRNQ